MARYAAALAAAWMATFVAWKGSGLPPPTMAMSAAASQQGARRRREKSAADLGAVEVRAIAETRGEALFARLTQDIKKIARRQHGTIAAQPRKERPDVEDK